MADCIPPEQNQKKKVRRVTLLLVWYSYGSMNILIEYFIIKI